MNAATPPSRPRDARRTPARSGAVALVALGLLTASGCTYTNAVTTQKPYVPSDGEDVRLTGDVSVSSLMVITEGEGEAGTLVARVVNDSADAQRVTISAPDADLDEVVAVPAAQTVSIGGTAEQTGVRQVVIDAVPAAPGLLVPMTVAVEGGPSQTVQVPVLDGTIEPYSEYLPAEVTPTTLPTATPLPAEPPAAPADEEEADGETAGDAESGSGAPSSSSTSTGPAASGSASSSSSDG